MFLAFGAPLFVFYDINSRKNSFSAAQRKKRSLFFGGRDDGTIFSIELWTEGDDDFPTRTRPRAQNSNVRQTNANDGQN